jgi:hypothetical protein
VEARAGLMSSSARPHGLNALFRKRDGSAEEPRYKWRFTTEKLFGDEWRAVGHFQTRDLDQLDRHARAMGGCVRLLRKRDGVVVVEWFEGVRIADEVMG